VAKSRFLNRGFITVSFFVFAVIPYPPPPKFRRRRIGDDGGAGHVDVTGYLTFNSG
jgi:hypothetical protein